MQEYETGKSLKNFRIGVQKYKLFPSLAEVGLECRECSRAWAVSVLQLGDLLHQGPGAGLRSPCPEGLCPCLSRGWRQGVIKLCEIITISEVPS